MTDPSGPPAPSRPVRAVAALTTIVLRFDATPTWGDLREYVAACSVIPDDEPLGFGYDEDEWPRIPGLEETFETAPGDGA